MKIVCDTNIPEAERVCSSLGQTVLAPGRQISSHMVKDADALLVRSVTPVDARLLEGSSVRFVASATIGVDHIDLDYLRRSAIAFAYAPGCNADSVAQYVVASLAWCARTTGWDPSGKTIGIIGVGNVGSRVARLSRALGLRPLLNDPPRARAEHDDVFRPLEEVLAQADVVTMHVPLTMAGTDATYHLVDERFVRRMKPGAIFVNTSRGRVVDEQALLGHRQRLHALILDVFDNEPSPSADIVRNCTLATPHIAGYSHDGKIRGTQMVYEALCRHLGRTPRIDLLAEIAAVVEAMEPSPDGQSVCDTILRAYPVHEDHARFAPILRLSNDERAAFFDRLRREYPVRLEFSHYRVPAGAAQPDVLTALGFRTDASS
ncbi:MAG: DUF3410 domain-containing protein [Chitinivibrionales bacterium]|nr:DUF3410 domain-containing protein [Chitinivibrionales bacterium]